MAPSLKSLPRTGLQADTVLSALEAARDADAAWKDGKVFSLVYNGGDAITDLLKRAYTTYFSENALNPTTFPSLKRMETEVVAMTAHLLGGSEQTVGNLTSGGTESILMAVKTAREWAKKHRPWVRHPELVVPVTAHPAFDKAAHYFGLRIVHVPCDANFQVDLAKLKRAVSWRTIMIVGSAPAYPQGVMDPIEQIAALAHKKGILCHVDACVGGMMLPFVRELGYNVPPFDLRVTGVTSMSVDLHKYGYAAKPASVVLHRDGELRKHQYFATTDWPGGIYVSPTMTGSRPGGAIAAAWAIMHHLGFEGYLEIAREVMTTRDKIIAGVEAIEGLHIQGAPHMSVMGFGADTPLDIYTIGDHMSERGWHMDRQQSPEGLHLTINRGHVISADQFLSDLREAVQLSQRSRADYLKQKIALKALNTTLRVIPAPILSAAMSIATKQLGLGGAGGALPKRSAAMYGMMGSLPNRGDLEAIVIDLLDGMTRFDPSARLEVPEDPVDGDRVVPIDLSAQRR